jgi:hypothetical protein
MTKPATMPVSVGVKPVLPCNSDSVVAKDEPGLTRLGQIDWPSFSIVALIGPLPESLGVASAPPESACAGAAPSRDAAKVVIANKGAAPIEPEERIDFTRVTLVYRSHVSGTVV